MTAVEKARNPVTPQMAIDIVARYEAGASMRQVAAAFNVHRQTVAHHLRAAGATLRRQGLSKEQTVHAAALYLSGLTLAQVGGQLGVAQGTVGRYL